LLLYDEKLSPTIWLSERIRREERSQYRSRRLLSKENGIGFGLNR
jgi:hypothetical protein